MFWDFLLAATLWAMTIQAQTPVTEQQNSTQNKTAEVVKRTSKTILLWRSELQRRFGWLPTDLQDATKDFRRVSCEQTPTCLVTANPSLVPLGDLDAVVFFMDRDQNTRVPATRSPGQRFVYFTSKAPPDVSVSADTRNVFNWTMTYRPDSDVPFPQGEVVPRGREPLKGWRSPPATPVSSEFLKDFLRIDDAGYMFWTTLPRATGLVVWLSNDCRPNSWRQKVVKRLATYISVDKYGKCNKFKYKRKGTISTKLLRRYKFFLAFEESFCRDYVSGEFFEALKHYLVPVVLGGANYSTVAPPYSYIDARDFDSLHHLAEYLKYLSEHRGEYSKFFWWKTFYEVKSPAAICRLCGKLHEPGPPKTYADMEKWWDEPTLCNALKPTFDDLLTIKPQ